MRSISQPELDIVLMRSENTKISENVVNGITKHKFTLQQRIEKGI